MSYFISLLSHRVLEVVALDAPQAPPCRVRFRLVPQPSADGGRVSVVLDAVSPAGGPWRPAMRDAVAAWCRVYLGCALVPGHPRAAPTTRRGAEQGKLGIRTPPGPAEPARR